MSNVSHILATHAARRPDAPAITQRRRRLDVTLSYAALDRHVSAEAQRLSAAGLAVGDRVLVLCPVGLELYVTVLALLRQGYVATFVDPGAGLRRLDACCERARPRAVIAAHRALLLRPWVRSLRWGPRWLHAARLNQHEPARHHIAAPPATVGPDHPALLTFTSGSTGAPKGVVRTHEFLNLQQQVVARDLALAPGQADLSTMPVFVLANLAAGVHSVLADVDLRRPGAADAQRLVAQIARHRPDRTLASPAMLDRLAEHCEAQHIQLDSLRRVDTGGAPVFPRTLRKLRLAMPNARIMVVYGSTEAEPIALLDATLCNATLRDRIQHGAGLPAGELTPGLDLRLLPPAWGQPIRPMSARAFDTACLGAGQVGEIVVHGKRVIRSYLDGVGDEQTKFTVDGHIWHRTGDLGRFDADGRLWLLGRAGAQLRDARGAIEPLAIEAAAMEHPAVVRCALVGIEGERVLVVQRDPARGGDRLEGVLLEQLSWAGIDRVLAVRRVPIDSRHNAKIDYPALRRLVGAAASSQ